MSSRTAFGRGTIKQRTAASSSSYSRITHSGHLPGNVVQTGTTGTIYGGGVKDPTGKTAEFSSMDDQCPVCKSDRYLNPKLRLLVSSCYHKMCESCIDRLFTLGPAPCPICNKVIRKIHFSPQTFEDLTVEREVAIRKRITKDFNKRREDFPDLKSYNDYLEMVEDITFNLINEIDVPETEARIAAYRKENEALIQLNIQRAKLELQAIQEEEELERQEREERMRELRLEEEEERREREKEKQAIIAGLESAKEGTAARIIAKTRAEAHKRTAARAALSAVPSARMPRKPANTVVVPDEPHQPLTDHWYTYEDRFQLRENYDDPWSEAVKADREGIMRAGGYRVEEAWERAVRLAVAGLEMMPLTGTAAAQTQDVPMAVAT